MAIIEVGINALPVISTVTGDEKIVLNDDPTGSPVTSTLTPNILKDYIKTAAVSANTTYTSSTYEDHIYATAGSVADVTITIPGASTVTDRTYRVTKVDTGDKNISVTATSGTINGQSSVELRSQYDYLYVISDGTNYIVLDFKITLDSGWLDYSAGSSFLDLTLAYTHNFNINCEKINATAWGAAAATDNSGQNLTSVGAGYSAAGSTDFGIQFIGNTNDIITVQTGADGMVRLNSTGNYTSFTSGYLRIILERTII